MVIPISGVVKIALINSSLTVLTVKIFKIVDFLLFVRNFLGLVPPQQIFVYQLFNFGFALRARIFHIFNPLADTFETICVFASV